SSASERRRPAAGAAWSTRRAGAAQQPPRPVLHGPVLHGERVRSSTTFRAVPLPVRRTTRLWFSPAVDTIGDNSADRWGLRPLAVDNRGFVVDGWWGSARSVSSLASRSRRC